MTKSLWAVFGAAVLLLGVVACAQRPIQGIPPSRWQFREFTSIRGVVMCSGCSLEEARARYPGTDHLYEFTGPQGEVVFRVDWVNDAVRWRQLTLGNRLWVRAGDRVFQKLTAPKDLKQPLELSAILRDKHTLDLASVTVLG